MPFSSSNRVQQPRLRREKGRKSRTRAQVFASEFCCEAWHSESRGACACRR
jgi:hypothetical protein